MDSGPGSRSGRDRARRYLGAGTQASLSLMLGGRAAEKLVFDEYSAGAEDDLRQGAFGEAHAAGAGLVTACGEIGICLRTLKR